MTSIYRGPGLPVQGRFKTDIPLIRDNIIQILNTRPGERVLVPEFGSRLHELLWQPNDETLAALARLYVKEAIERWEDRVQFLDARVVQQDDQLYLTLTVRYKLFRIQDEIPVTLRG